MAIPSFHTLLTRSFEGPLLALDPGNTTGVAIFQDAAFLRADEIKTDTLPVAADALKKLLDDVRPRYVVYESYRVYKWKAEDHVHNDLHTPKVIGVIETLCHLYNTPAHDQTAQVAKQFVTDDKLRAWDLWIKGKRHSRDACRHGAYFLLFNWPKISDG